MPQILSSCTRHVQRRVRTKPGRDVDAARTQQTTSRGARNWPLLQSHCCQGPRKIPDRWPEPAAHPNREVLKRGTPGPGTTTGTNALATDSRSHTSPADHLETIAKAARTSEGSSKTADGKQEAEVRLLQRVQGDWVAPEIVRLMVDKPLPSSSCLWTLTPEFDSVTPLICKGQLHHSPHREPLAIPPMVLDWQNPNRPVAQVIQLLSSPNRDFPKQQISTKIWGLLKRDTGEGWRPPRSPAHSHCLALAHMSHRH